MGKNNMNSAILRRIVFFAIISVFCSVQVPCQSPTPQIDIPALIKECIKNGLKNDKAVVDSYTYTKKTTTRQGIRDVVQVVDVYPKNGRVSEKRVSVNGYGISKKADEREQKRVAEELERDANERQAHPEAAPSQIKYGFYDKFVVSILDFLTIGEFSGPRMERYHDKDMLVMDFRPRADFHPDEFTQYPLARLQGTVWIDVADKLAMRVEAWPISGTSRPYKPGTSSVRKDRPVIFEYTRLPEGTWVINFAQFITIYDPPVFNNLKYYISIEYKNYKRFETSVGDPDIVDPKAKKKP